MIPFPNTNLCNLSYKLYSKHSKLADKVYPEDRSDYTSKVGKIAEINARLLVQENLDSDADTHLIQESGADIVVQNYDIGIEYWNWSSPHSYNKRVKSVIKNLEPFEHKAIIASFMCKETRKRIEEAYPNNPIIVKITGFQYEPLNYLSFYTDRQATEGKKFANKRTRKVMDNIIKSLFSEMFGPSWGHEVKKHRVKQFTILDCYINGECYRCKEKSQCPYKEYPFSNSGYVYSNVLNTGSSSVNGLGCWLGRDKENDSKTSDEGKSCCNHSSIETYIRKGRLLEALKHKLKGLLSWVRPLKDITKRFTSFLKTIRAISIVRFEIFTHLLRKQVQVEHGFNSQRKQ